MNTFKNINRYQHHHRHQRTIRVDNNTDLDVSAKMFMGQQPVCLCRYIAVSFGFHRNERNLISDFSFSCPFTCTSTSTFTSTFSMFHAPCSMLNARCSMLHVSVFECTKILCVCMYRIGVYCVLYTILRSCV